MSEYTVLFEDCRSYSFGVSVWHYKSREEARQAIIAQKDNRSIYRAALLPRETYNALAELGVSDDYLLAKFRTSLLNPS